MVQISRADILRLLAGNPKGQELTDYIELFGYELQPSEEIAFTLPEMHFEPPVTSKEEGSFEIDASDIDFRYFLLESVEEQPIDQNKDEELEHSIAWLYESEKQAEPPKGLGKLPKKSRLLFNWPLLKESLQEVLSASKKRNQIDLEMVVKKISRAIPLRTLPKRIKERQTSNIHLISDYSSEHLRPVFRDFTELSKKLTLLFGEHYLKQKVLKHRNNISALLKSHREKRSLSHLQGTRVVIVISDLGLYFPSDDVLNEWLAFAQIARSYSCQPIAIVPVPARYLDARVTTAFNCICIESGTPITTKHVPELERRRKAIAKDQNKAKETLLTALASSPFITPDLLRATRDLFDPQECDMATEILAWTHPDVYSDPSYICLRSEKNQDYKSYLENLGKLPRFIQEGVRQNFVYYHSLFFKEKLVTEISLLDSICDFRDDLSKYCTIEYQNIARRLRTSPNPTRNYFVQQQLKRYSTEQELFLRDNGSQREKSNYATVMFTLLREQSKYSDIPPEPWLDKDVFFHMEKKKSSSMRVTRNLKLLQFSNHLLLMQAENAVTQNPLLPKGNFVADLSLKGEVLFIRTQYKNKVSREQLVQLDEQLPYRLDTTSLEQLILRFPSPEGNFIYKLKSQVKTDWAEAISSNPSEGNLVLTSKSNSYYWHSKLVKKTDSSEILRQRGYWYIESLKNYSKFKLPWADVVNSGDGKGLCAELKVEGVVQHFRWIEPDEFLMGSPENEEGRYEEEVLHRVRLSEGFWLADTACTQALWKAVMGNNPSDFKGDNLPVENVSWHEVKDFIVKLNNLVKGLNARLPTEAEWEYACRAGTSTPFAYGEEADPKLMNFSSDLGKTIPVYSSFQNAWGLYQMHGNVWEWCEDWYGEYDIPKPDTVIIDPRGPNTGSNRVLRGGSWGHYARYCRSAYRYWDRPEDRDDDIGFRLASGHQVQVTE